MAYKNKPTKDASRDVTTSDDIFQRRVTNQSEVDKAVADGVWVVVVDADPSELITLMPIKNNTAGTRFQLMGQTRAVTYGDNFVSTHDVSALVAYDNAWVSAMGFSEVLAGPETRVVCYNRASAVAVPGAQVTYFNHR